MNRDLLWSRFVSATWCRVFGHRYTVRHVAGFTCSACHRYTYRRGGAS